MKCWKIRRNYRRTASTLSDTVSRIAHLPNILLTDRETRSANHRTSYETSLGSTRSPSATTNLPTISSGNLARVPVETHTWTALLVAGCGKVERRERDMPAASHRYTTVCGGAAFSYRQEGPSETSAVVLRHGFPASRLMFRCLIPLGTDQYHVITADRLGFGLSAVPAADEFDCTLHAVAGRSADLLNELGLSRYILYVQDYCARIDLRLAVVHPRAITVAMTQSGNACDLQLALFADYEINLPLPPEVYAWLRNSREPVLAVWGRNDEVFRSEGRKRFGWTPRRRDPSVGRRALPDGRSNRTLSGALFETCRDDSVLSRRSCP